MTWSSAYNFDIGISEIWARRGTWNRQLRAWTWGIIFFKYFTDDCFTNQQSNGQSQNSVTAHNFGNLGGGEEKEIECTDIYDEVLTVW